MENNVIAAKRHKKRKTDCFYAPFASFRGYSLFPLCSLSCSLLSNAKNAPESAICSVLSNWPAPTGSVAWLSQLSIPKTRLIG